MVATVIMIGKLFQEFLYNQYLVSVIPEDRSEKLHRYMLSLVSFNRGMDLAYKPSRLRGLIFLCLKSKYWNESFYAFLYGGIKHWIIVWRNFLLCIIPVCYIVFFNLVTFHFFPQTLINIIVFLFCNMVNNLKTSVMAWTLFPTVMTMDQWLT